MVYQDYLPLAERLGKASNWRQRQRLHTLADEMQLELVTLMVSLDDRRFVDTVEAIACAYGSAKKLIQFAEENYPEITKDE